MIDQNIVLSTYQKIKNTKKVASLLNLKQYQVIEILILNKIFNSPKENEIINLHKSGYSITRIAKNVKTATYFVVAYLKRNNLFVSKKERGNSNEIEILKLNASGKDSLFIAAVLNLSNSYVNYVLRKNNIIQIKRIKISNNKITCQRCFKEKPICEFVRSDTEREKRLSHFCLSCRSRAGREKIIATDLSFFTYKIKVLLINNDKVNLTPEQLIDIYNKQNRKCFYTDAALEFDSKNIWESLSIDKIFPDEGYVLDNIVISSYWANTIKTNLPIALLKKFIPKFYERIKKYKSFDDKIEQSQLDSFIKNNICQSNEIDLSILKKNILSKKNQCAKNGLSFNLTFESVLEKLKNQNFKCFYSGFPLKIKKGKGRFNSLSLDKIDPTLGYTLNNIVICCRGMNLIKLNSSKELLKEYSPFMYNKLFGRNGIRTRKN